MRRRASALTIAGRERAAPEPALFAALNASFNAALEADTPQCWRSVCDANFNLRTHLRKIDVRESSFFDTLVAVGDMIESALKEASKEPRNAIAFRELEEVRESLDEAQARIREERSRTPVWQREKRRRLDEADGQFEEGKRQINILSGNSLTIHVDVDGIVAEVKELVEVIEKGVKLTQDADFTGPLKRAADKVWQTTKRFVRANRQRFAALRLPWRKTAADDKDRGGGRAMPANSAKLLGAVDEAQLSHQYMQQGPRGSEGWVACSVFAPSTMRSLSHALIQVFIHQIGEHSAVAELANANRSQRGSPNHARLGPTCEMWRGD